MGWRDDSTVDSILSRLSGKGVNRVRALIYGREYDNPWNTPVRSSEDFSLCLNPWVARYPTDVTNPEFDLSRFNLPFWHRFERMLVAADERGVQVSVCFFIGGQPLAVPFAMWSEDEYRYYRYAVARLAAFPNVMWDLGTGVQTPDTRRRVCWEVAMAGFYQTNGETPAGGTGVDSDTGGEWVNGRGAETSTMFDHIKPMTELFTSLSWWRLRPNPETIVEYEPSNPGRVACYYRDGQVASDLPAQVLCDEFNAPVLVYLPYGGRARVRSEASLNAEEAEDPRLSP